LRYSSVFCFTSTQGRLKRCLCALPYANRDTHQLFHWLSTDHVLSRYPLIRARIFPALPHHLRWPLGHMASMSCTQNTSWGRLCHLAPAYASYDVLVHQLADPPHGAYSWCIRLPSDHLSRVGPCHSLVVIVY